MEVQYLTNSKGEKTAVQLSMEDWRTLWSNPHVFEMFKDLQQAFREMQAYEGGDKSMGMTAEEFFAQLELEKE